MKVLLFGTFIVFEQFLINKKKVQTSIYQFLITFNINIPGIRLWPDAQVCLESKTSECKNHELFTSLQSLMTPSAEQLTLCCSCGAAKR